jgi:hypothetical protein
MPTQVLNQTIDSNKMQSFGNTSTMSIDGSSHSAVNDENVKADNVPVYVKPKTAGYVFWSFCCWRIFGDREKSAKVLGECRSV